MEPQGDPLLVIFRKMTATFIPYAVLSGIFASLSSVFAKLFSDTRTVLIHDALRDFVVKQDFASTLLSLTVDPNVRRSRD